MDNQRTFLYIALGLIVFMIWQAWQRDYGPKPVAEVETISTSQQQAPAAAPEDIPDAAEAVRSDMPVSAPTRQDVSSRQVRVITDTLDILIDTRGGDIVQADLLTYPLVVDQPDKPFRLLSNEGASVYVAQSGLIHDKTGDRDVSKLSPSHYAIYDAAQTEYRLADGAEELTVPLTWESANGIKVTKTYTFKRGQFLLELDYQLENQSTQPWIGRQYRQLRHGDVQKKDKKRFIYTFTGSAYYNGKYQKLQFDDMEDEALAEEVTGGWVSILQHYFVSAWIPQGDEKEFFYTRVVKDNGATRYIIGMRSQPITVAPGENGQLHTRLYVGPKIQKDLAPLANRLELTTDYGIFTALSKPLFWLLDKIHSVVGNWGWAIIILTLIIKLSFYKLSEAQHRSMAKMRNLQPRMVAMKERFGDDKQKFQQAMMELYKKEKVNPLGGCLPLLIQMPVFISLYWVLLESAEMRQAPFMLWINDLSSKDPYYVLPVLMGITMFISQKLNPQPADPVQAKIMMMLPLVFTVFFAFFPSGLVLYWFFNNLLTIIQQYVITRRIEQAAH